MIDLRDPTAYEHLTLDSVVNNAIKFSIKDNRIILIRNGAKPQIDIILKNITSKFKEQYTSDFIYVLDGDKDRDIINQIYDLALCPNGCHLNVHYIIFDYFNFVEKDRNYELDYVIDVMDCFGCNLPQ